MHDATHLSVGNQHSRPAAEPYRSPSSPPDALFVDNRPEAIAQHMLADAIHGSPYMVAQRKQLRGMFGNAAQLQAGAEEHEMQMKAAPGVPQRPEEAVLPQGKFGAAQLQEEPVPQPNKTGLPDNLKAGIENLSGMSMDNIKVHYSSSQPTQLNALAYAQGSDILVAPGQEQHLPHEAWHVVQQAQGRVKPTMQVKGGVPVNDDQGLEHEADVMGAKALLNAAQLKGDPVQRQVPEEEALLQGKFATLPCQGPEVEALRMKAGAWGRPATITGAAEPAIDPGSASIQRRGTPLDLPRAQVIVAGKKTTILQAVQQTTNGFTALQQHWSPRLVVEADKPEVGTWNILRTQLDTDCVAAPTTDDKKLGANVRGIVHLGERLAAAAPPALTALQPALSALAAAGNDAALAGLVLLLGETCGGIDQGVAQLVPLGQLLQAAGSGAHALATRACLLTQNNAATAASAALFLAPYAADPKADAVSEQVLREAGLDTTAATQRMTSLRTWGYDLKLEGWSESQSDTLAQEGVDKIKQDAQEKKFLLEGALPKEPGNKPARGKKEKKWEHEARVKEWSEAKTGREQGQKGIQAEVDKLTGADAKKPGLKKQHHEDMTGFMATWTPSLGVELAGWTLQLANGKQPLAAALAKLQSSAQLGGLDTQDWASWAIRESPDPAGIAALQSAVEVAIQAGCAPAVARTVATYQLTAKLTPTLLQKFANAVAASPGEVQEIIGFLQTQAPLAEALDALHRAVTVGLVSVVKLAAFCHTHGVETTAWALTKGTGNLKDSEKLLGLLGDKVSKEQLAKLLQKGTTDELVTLLNRVDFSEPNPERLLKLYTKADSAQLTTLLAPPDGFTSDNLEGWLVTKDYAVADIITLLGLSTSAAITAMVSNSNATPTQVLAAYNQLNTGNGDGIDMLQTLIQTWPGKALPVLVGAHLSKGAWDQGSFGDVMESIFYHHTKHGAGQTIEQYTQDATALWSPANAFNWTDDQGRNSWKIQGPPGGTFHKTTHLIFSFWYA